MASTKEPTMSAAEADRIVYEYLDKYGLLLDDERAARTVIYQRIGWPLRIRWIERPPSGGKIGQKHIKRRATP